MKTKFEPGVLVEDITKITEQEWLAGEKALEEVTVRLSSGLPHGAQPENCTGIRKESKIWLRPRRRVTG